MICKFVSKRYLFLEFDLHFCINPWILGCHCTYFRTKAKVIKSRSMALVFFRKIERVLGCNDNHTYIRFYTKKFFCFCWTVYTKIPHSVHTRLLTLLSKSKFFDGWIDGLGSLLPRCWLNSKHNEPFKGSTRLQIFLKGIRTDLRFSYQNSHIKSIGSMNVKFMSKVILVLAHRLHWGYILNPKVLLLHSSWLNEFQLMQGCTID